MHHEKLNSLRIDSSDKQRPKSTLRIITLAVLGLTAAAFYFAWPRESDSRRVMGGKPATPAPAAENRTNGSHDPRAVRAPDAAAQSAQPSAAPGAANSLLTVSGYIINRERIEISPRFMGVVKWIGVRKGDAVTNGQVVVLLDDSEYRARLREAEGRLENARVNIDRAKLDLQRAETLVAREIEMQKTLDDARLQLRSAEAGAREAEGAAQLIRTYLDWCVIRAPVDGVILEKLVDPGELVTPQSFGGTRGPSTALLAVADPKDLQVEIDLNEADLSKVSLKQICRVSPEAYPEKLYEGYVAEIAPEASRQKGTLQIKVQIRNPDRYLTPELSAKVDFLAAPAANAPSR